VEPQPPATENPEQAPRRRKLLIAAAIVGGLCLVIAVIGVFGGLKAKPSGATQVKPGETLDQGRFTVTVLSARVGDVKGPLDSKAKHSLIVRMRVTNNGTDTASLDGDLKIGMTGVPKPGKHLDPAEVTGLANGSPTTLVQPGLPVEADASWELNPGSAPTQAVIAFRKWEHGAGFSDPQIVWKVFSGSAIAATVTVPVAAS
jgi:hypothetical protein